MKSTKELLTAMKKKAAVLGLTSTLALTGCGMMNESNINGQDDSEPLYDYVIVFNGDNAEIYKSSRIIQNYYEVLDIGSYAIVAPHLNFYDMNNDEFIIEVARSIVGEEGNISFVYVEEQKLTKVP